MLRSGKAMRKRRRYAVSFHYACNGARRRIAPPPSKRDGAMRIMKVAWFTHENQMPKLKRIQARVERLLANTDLQMAEFISSASNGGGGVWLQ